MKLHHVGIAVRSITATTPAFGALLALQLTEQEELAEERVRVAFFEAGNARIELLEPIGDEGSVARFLATRGQGLHHLAFAVDDIARALRAAEAAGFRPIDRHPRRGAGGLLIGFLHPKETWGVLIEFVQVPV